MLKEISGGVCAPKGFKAAGVYCGVKSGHADAPQTILPSARGKNDLAMILSDCECSAAAVYTLNRVKAAPIYVTMGNPGGWSVPGDRRQLGQCQCLRAHES